MFEALGPLDAAKPSRLDRTGGTRASPSVKH